MNIYEFDFPSLTPTDIIFSIIKTDDRLLAEAKDKGFYNSNTPYNRLFSKLFFDGGELNLKKDLDPKFKDKALPYLRALMGSFEPKHEDKEAVCALLLSYLVDTEDNNAKN